MKSILSICALILVLPRKLAGETTLNPSSTRQHKDTSKDQETTIRGDKPTIFSTKIFYTSLKPYGEATHSPSSTRLHKITSEAQTTQSRNKPTIFLTKIIDLSLTPNGEATHSPSSTRLHKITSEDQTTPSSDKPTISSKKISDISLKTNGEATQSPSSTRLHKITSEDQTIPTHSSSSTRLHNGSSKDHGRTMKSDEPTSSSSKIQDNYTTEESKNILSMNLPRQTSAQQHVPSTSHAEHLKHTMKISTRESRSSSHVSSLPFMTELASKIPITPLPQNMSEEVITTRDDHQTTHNFTSTSKGFDRHIQGNKTTRSAEKESLKPLTHISTHFQTPPEVITNQSVQITETLTTKWSSLPQEKESTPRPIINTTNSNGTLDITSEERMDTVTYALNASTNTSLTTGLGPTVNTEFMTSDTTKNMDTEASYKTTTKDMSTEGKHPNPNTEIIPNTQTDTKTSVPKSHTIKNNNKSHPGPIVASLIGSILFLMFVAFLVVFVRSRKMKKKQMENPDWAGPSPFIEADIHPNLPTIDEDGPFHIQETKRFSLHSFLPQQLSKRFSMLSPTDEEIPLENAQASSTFGQRNVQPLNGKATSDQIQVHEANSPPAELSSDSNVPETVSIPPPPENNENIQTTIKLDEEIISSPPPDTNSATQAPFEDVDLNHSLDKNIESTTSADAIHIPSPPPLAPS